MTENPGSSRRGARVLLVVAVALATAVAPHPFSVLATDAPSFSLGFKVLAGEIAPVAGTPVEDEHYGPNGDSLQQTTKGLMVWRKADNWTAFTNGSRTWVNGPFGVMERANEDRFDWERSGPAASPFASPPPVLVDSVPSDYDLFRKETTLSLPGGRSLLRVSLSNRNHYWTAGQITVSVTLLDVMGRSVAAGPAMGDVASLGPQQSSTWDFDVPAGVQWQTATPSVSFRWVSPGG